MDNKNQLSHCRVCGLDQKDLPWGVNGDSPSFAICDCCGVEFGYQDCFLEDVVVLRKEWLKKGALWAQPKERAGNWSLEKQLEKIPDDFK
jgi:hypothetical protein